MTPKRVQQAMQAHSQDELSVDSLKPERMAIDGELLTAIAEHTGGSKMSLLRRRKQESVANQREDQRERIMLIELGGTSKQVFELNKNNCSKKSVAYNPLITKANRRIIHLLPQNQQQQQQPPASQQNPSKDSIYAIFDPKMISAMTVATLGATLAIICLLAVVLQSRSSSMLVNGAELTPPSAAEQTAGDQKHPKAILVRQAQAGARPTSGSISRGSIDRFDSGVGEQIRAPLLRPPTTLKPMAGTEGQPQNGDQTASNTQNDSTFLSPEEREQLMRSQEGHYEGRQAGSDEPQGASGGSEQAVGGQMQSGQADATPLAGQQHDVALQATEASDSGPEGDSDPDYDGADSVQAPEEGPMAGGVQQQARRVPDIRRAASQAEQKARNALEQAEGDGSNELGGGGDDYGGASDDAYFSRKQPPAVGQQQQKQGNQNNGANLKLAASYNQQQQQRDSGHQQSPDESAGFGPGPNEAYLAERAESPNSLGGGEDDDADPDPEGPMAASSTTDPDGNEPDELSGDQTYQVNPSRFGNGAAGAPALRSRSNEPDRGDALAQADSDADGSPPSAESSGGDSFASSSQSGPTRSTVSRDSAARLQTGLAMDPMVGVASGQMEQLKQQNVAQWQQARLRQNPHLLAASQNTGRNGKMLPTTSGQPYNPQNNPSHAGKYFIN